MKRIVDLLCIVPFLLVSVICLGHVTIFKSLAVVNVNMVLFNKSWTEPNPIACASHCLSTFRSCYGFVYNKETKLCTPGSWLIPSNVSYDVHSGVLYTTGAFCPTDFTVEHAGTLASCLHIFKNKNLNYTASLSNCKAIGSVIYTMKSMEKKTILQKELKNEDRSFWIGLDDLLSRGRFAWADDNKVINANLSIKLFAPNEPNHHGSIEDCVVYNPSRNGLNDVDCKRQLPSVCEMNPDRSALKSS